MGNIVYVVHRQDQVGKTTLALVDTVALTTYYRRVQAPIYMDNMATTRVDPRVLERMLPFFSEVFGNAASRSHSYGWQAEAAVEAAREQVARLIGATPTEVIFTSGATESNNLALFGAARAYESRGKHIITQSTEHKAVLDVCAALQEQGFDITLLPVDRCGRLNPEAFAAALRPDTILASVMLANNEVGALQPVAEIGALCRRAGVILHCDAAQAAGKMPVDVEALNVDLLSISAHKFYGPKGVGALYVRRRNPRVNLVPMFYGGGHERTWRSGTLNVPGIVGLGEACELARSEGVGQLGRIEKQRDTLQSAIMAALDGVTLNGPERERLAGCLNLTFDGVEGESLLLALRGVAVSSGSACTSASRQPSHVLLAMGVSSQRAMSSIRFGLGRFTTDHEVVAVAQMVVDEVRRLRENAKRYGTRGQRR